MMDAAYIEVVETGERWEIREPVWITQNRNGLVRTPHRVKALGIGDGERIWSFGTPEGYPEARLITRAEYEERPGAPDPDPELTAEEALNIILGGSYETE